MIKHLLSTMAEVDTVALALTLLPATVDAKPALASETVTTVTSTLPVAKNAASTTDERSTGPSSTSSVRLDVATPALVPIIGFILGMVVRYGIKHVIKVFGKQD
ncbi:hypothetical protein [Paeniglutamicibacter gangotriensis]|uniref:Uncharacterized protein n=1 Tax=Paeniglutamicibacter gangotriensis Lz1y TaxID=1276920 RepID=M7N885_9MICC|nr:hypothetical protein [Paeniglutamicibacter gangotriensis]EMQ97999.1 hypothetical protein ADIAG_02509 [Paeniglutamicibacter gangotriensis Lz1y]